MLQPAPLFSEIAEGPENGMAFWVKADDGMRIRVGIWGQDISKHGTIVLFPGRTEYIELQGRTARDLTRQGFAVLTMDWRGHGLSDRVLSIRETLHVNRYSDYQLDVAAIIKAAKSLDVPEPWFLLGNSMGGCIGLRALFDGLPVAACAFTAPMWGVKMLSLQKAVALPVTWTAHAIGRGHSYIPGHNGKNYVLNNPFEGNRITRDEGMYNFWLKQARAKPCLQTAGSTMRWLHQSLLECRRLAKMSSPDVPCVAFCGDNDGLVEVNAISRRLAGWSNGSFEQIPGAKHALLLEVPEVRNRIIAKIAGHFIGSLREM